MSVDLIICVDLNKVIYTSTAAATSRVKDIQLPLLVGPPDFRRKVFLFKENEVVCAIDVDYMIIQDSVRLMMMMQL